MNFKNLFHQKYFLFKTFTHSHFGITCSTFIAYNKMNFTFKIPLKWGASSQWSSSLYSKRNSVQMIIRKTHPTLLYGVKKRRLLFSSQNDATVKVIPKNVWLLLRNFISPSHLEVLKTFFAVLKKNLFRLFQSISWLFIMNCQDFAIKT